MQVDDIEILRYDIMDAIGDCCRVIGATMCLPSFVRALEMYIPLFLSLPVEAQVTWLFLNNIDDLAYNMLLSHYVRLLLSLKTLPPTTLKNAAQKVATDRSLFELH